MAPKRSGEDAPNGHPKVLVVEDELLIGMDLVMMLQEWGYDAIGPVTNLEKAQSAIGEELPDLAILDVNLGNGETSLPLAHKLAEEQVPFVFLTGYDPSRYEDAETIRERPHLRKPVAEQALRDALAALTAGERA